MSSTSRIKCHMIFTLIELLIVIAIIAVLASLLLPSLNKSRDYAKSIQCIGSLKMLTMGALEYSDSYNGWALPLCYGYVAPGYKDAWYLGNSTLYPAFAQSVGVPDSVTANGNGYTLAFICPKASYALATPFNTKPVSYPISRSYGMNLSILGSAGAWGSTDYLGLMLNQVKHPSTKVQFNDGTDWELSKSNSLYSIYIMEGELKTGGTNAVTAYRHTEGANAGFFDGHVANIRYQDLQNNTLYWDNN